MGLSICPQKSPKSEVLGVVEKKDEWDFRDERRS